MAKNRIHPKRNKYCALCHYWMGDAELKFISNSSGFEYEQYANGKCAKRNTTMKAHSGCPNYSPSVEASKLL